MERGPGVEGGWTPWFLGMSLDGNSGCVCTWCGVCMGGCESVCVHTWCECGLASVWQLAPQKSLLCSLCWFPWGEYPTTTPGTVEREAWTRTHSLLLRCEHATVICVRPCGVGGSVCAWRCVFSV